MNFHAEPSPEGAGGPGRPAASRAGDGGTVPAALPADVAGAGGHLPVALAAWTLADPGVAAELLAAWLATADGSGKPTPACPVACQLAERVVQALPAPEEFLARILPGLARVAANEFARYDERGTGLPLWPAAAEALLPGEFAPGRFTVDLAVLLSNEAAAFGRLAAGRSEFERACDDLAGEKRELDAWLLETFWDEETATFARHDGAGAAVADLSPCGFVPLVWEARTEAMSEGLRTRTAELDVRAWSPRAWILLFALLLDSPHASVVAQMRRRGLPPGAAPAEEAAWTVLTQGVERARAARLRETPRAARWLDAHGRRLARGLFVAGAAGLVVLLGRSLSHRDGDGPPAGAELERRARQYCADGQHARAAALYGRAARGGDAAYYRYRQAGEWLHLEQYADAEAAYRAVLARAPATPNARLNLALAVLKQGRREEALELYRACAADPAAETHPELAERARLAAELLARQIALDRP